MFRYNRSSGITNRSLYGRHFVSIVMYRDRPVGTLLSFYLRVAPHGRIHGSDAVVKEVDFEIELLRSGFYLCLVQNSQCTIKDSPIVQHHYTTVGTLFDVKS